MYATLAYTGCTNRSHHTHDTTQRRITHVCAGVRTQVSVCMDCGTFTNNTHERYGLARCAAHMPPQPQRATPVRRSLWGVVAVQHIVALFVRTGGCVYMYVLVVYICVGCVRVCVRVRVVFE